MCQNCLRKSGGDFRGEALKEETGGGVARVNCNGPDEFIISSAHIITMDKAVGDLPNASIHVRNGEIIGVGALAPAASGIAVIDAAGAIVMPGLVDTHWHMWHTLFRSFAGTTKETGFYPTITRLAGAMSPIDMHVSAALASAEAINGGITTVHDWCHNIRSKEHAECDIAALCEAGIRGRWSFGQRIDQPDSVTIDLALLREMSDHWPSYVKGARLALGMAWRGMYRSEWLDAGVYRREFDVARELGLPISTHIATLSSRAGHIEAHYKARLLGPDVNIVHACGATSDELAMIRESGATVSLTVLSELRGGWGVPPLSRCLDLGIPVGLGVDTLPLVGEANMFKNMAIAVAMENGIASDEFKLLPRTVLELATIGGARVLGIDHLVGSLKPGKRADLIMLKTGTLNTTPFTDAAHLVVECMRPENVDTVIIDGAILKQAGRLSRVDVPSLLERAQKSFGDLRQRMGWRQ